MAIRTISAAGGNYNSTATWDEGVVPTNADDVVVRADGTSGSVTVTAAAAAKTLDLTAGAYNGTFTIDATFTLTVSGSVTLNSSGTCPGPVGGGSLSINTTATLTSNGKTIGCNFIYTTAPATLTLADDANITGLLTATSSSNNITFTSSGRTVTVAGGVSATGRLFTLTNTTLKVTGGTLNGTSNASFGIAGTGTFEFAGNVTCGATGPFLRCSTVKFTSGTISGGSISFGGNVALVGACSLPTTSFRMRVSGTLTLDSAFSCGADFNVVGVTLTMAGAQTVTLTGTFGVTATTGTSTLNPGTCTFVTSTVTLNAATSTMLRLIGSFTFDTVNLSGTATLIVDSGNTLSVSSAFNPVGTPLLSPTVRSQTANVAFTLALGTAIVQSAFATYTDVSVTGVVVNNAFSGPLTRTSGIVALATNESLDSTDPGIANVRDGAGYTIDGVPLVGAYTGRTSYGYIQ